MLNLNSSDLIVTRGSRISRAPPHQTLPAFLNLHSSSFLKRFTYSNKEILVRAKRVSVFWVSLLWMATVFIFNPYFAKVLKGQNIGNSRSSTKTVRRSRKNFLEHVRRNRTNFHTYRPGFDCYIISRCFKIEKSESFFTQNQVVIDRW